MTHQINVLQRARGSYNVQMTNLYTLKSHSNVYAYNL